MSIDEREYMYDPKLFRRHLSERETAIRTKALRARRAAAKKPGIKEDSTIERLLDCLPKSITGWILVGITTTAGIAAAVLWYAVLTF